MQASSRGPAFSPAGREISRGASMPPANWHPSRHHVRSSPLPRQQSKQVLRRWGLRADYESFQKTGFQRLLLEYDDERFGGFELLQQVPEDRTVALGLVSSKKASPRVKAGTQAAHRAGKQVHFSRSHGFQSSVWLRFHAGRELGHGSRPRSQASTCGRHGARSLGQHGTDKTNGSVVTFAEP